MVSTYTIEKSTILHVLQYYISRVYRLTDIRLVSRWVRSNGAKRTGKPTKERISLKAEERERKRFVIKSMSNRVNRMASSRSSHYRRYGIGSRYARHGNVVTGNGIVLRRCSPDGRTNVRVLLFQLCRLRVFPLHLFHLRLALSYNSAIYVRLSVTVYVYRSNFFLFSGEVFAPVSPSE